MSIAVVALGAQSDRHFAGAVEHVLQIQVYAASSDGG
jgi:hypothetical protein